MYCVWECVGKCWCLQKPEMEVGSTGAGVTSSCDWPSMGSGKWTLVLCSKLQSHIPNSFILAFPLLISVSLHVYEYSQVWVLTYVRVHMRREVELGVFLSFSLLSLNGLSRWTWNLPLRECNLPEGSAVSTSWIGSAGGCQHPAPSRPPGFPARVLVLWTLVYTFVAKYLTLRASFLTTFPLN